MRSKKLRAAFTLVFLCIARVVSGEVYQGIGPLDTLADVKKRFPNAKYEHLQPAWAQEADVMYSVSGSGLSGTIIIKFHDPRPTYSRMLGEHPEAETAAMLTTLAGQAEADALNVEWVRWVPSRPIPLSRFVLKYGKPQKAGFSDEDLQPYKSWTTRGLMAFISDNGQVVERVDYSFTREEMRQSYQVKYGFVPDFLKGN